MKESTAEARELINAVKDKHGDLFQEMDRGLSAMIREDDRHSLLLYSGLLLKQIEKIYEHVGKKEE